MIPKNVIIGYPFGVVYGLAGYIVRSSSASHDRSFQDTSAAKCFESLDPPILKLHSHPKNRGQVGPLGCGC
jgi:hypothetical protein